MNSSENYTGLRIDPLFGLAYRSNMDLKVRELRKARGWSQAEMAEHCGLRQATISKVESRPEKTELETLLKIVTGLGCSFGDLFEGLPQQTDMRELSINFLRLTADDRSSITRQVEALAEKPSADE